MNISVILSGGSGSRFGSESPKQYKSLLGREIISYSIQALRESALTDNIIIAADYDSLERLADEYNIPCIQGGASRNESLYNALKHIKKHYTSCQKVFINEAARPFLTAEIADKYYGFLDDYDAVITTQRITDSLGRDGEAVTNRDEYYLVQAPEAFQFDKLYKSFSPDSQITATVQQLPENRKVMKYFDFKNNLKITYPEDLLAAEHLMRLRG